MSKDRPQRAYRKVARAKKEAETRRRITEATVALHGSVGPAKTRITDVARLAGVSRMTVYSHFPTETDLFRACSNHWSAANPFPDPSEWGHIPDVSDRLQVALRQIYNWYGENREMLGLIFRDVGSVPALGEVMDELWAPHAESVVEALTSGWSVEPSEAQILEALVRWVTDFASWTSLTESGMSLDDAATLASRVVVQSVRTH